MNLKYDGPLSNFAFNCNLRHYIKAGTPPAGFVDPFTEGTVAGPCALSPLFQLNVSTFCGMSWVVLVMTKLHVKVPRLRAEKWTGVRLCTAVDIGDETIRSAAGEAKAGGDAG